MILMVCLDLIQTEMDLSPLSNTRSSKLVDEGKLQPSSDRMVEEWTKNKNNVDNTYDYDDHIKQQEMYKKAARGEVPEPGETIK